MKNKVSINDLLVLISWVKIYHSFEMKNFDYQRIFDMAEDLVRDGAEYFDVSDGNIDYFMADAYKIYTKIAKSKMIIEKLGDDIKISNVDKEMMIEESQRFEKIIQYMLENIKYEYSEIRGIQKGYLSEKMRSCVEIEDYENAAKFRDLIKEC